MTGGIDLAAEWAGFTTVGFCEIEPFCQKVLKKHWPNVPIWEDVRDVTAESFRKRTGLSTVDLVSGGFPCQPFSIAGKRRGKEDDRYLWPEMFRVIQELRPAWVLGENVVHFVNMALDTVLSDLESEGYETATFVIPACAVGAPHRRDRVWIVAYDNTFRRDMRGLEGQGVRWSDEARDETDSGSQDVAYADNTRLQGYWRYKSSCQQPAWKNGATIERKRFSQPRLGGVLDGLPDWLDGHRWPAPLGCEQYEWEPPRLARGVKNRAARLKALGNAVVPQQVYPILAAIAENEALWHAVVASKKTKILRRIKNEIFLH